MRGLIFELQDHVPHISFSLFMKYISWWLPWCHAIDITEHFAFSSIIIDCRHFEVMCLIFLMHGLWSNVYCLWIASNFSWNHTQQQVQQHWINQVAESPCRGLFSTQTPVVTKTRNDPQRPTTIHNDPQRPTTIPQRPTTTHNDPTTIHNDPQRSTTPGGGTP